MSAQDLPSLAAEFSASLAERADEPCVVDGQASLDGRECLAWCEAAAAALAAAASGGPRACAILAPRSWLVPLAILAARQAGLAFLCLDADAPDARLANILSRARPAAVISPAGSGPRVGRLMAAAGLRTSGHARLPSPGRGLADATVAFASAPRDLPPGTGHLAFTSGSSGEPKGVLLSEAGLISTVRAQVDLLGPGHGASAWMLNPSFDASLSDILCAVVGRRPLVAHGPAATRTKALEATLRDCACADIPPCLMRLLDPRRTGLRSVIFGGERADPTAARRWGAATRAFQAYGPTEDSVCAAMARAWDGWEDGLLGRPLPGHRLLLSCGDGSLHEILPAFPDASPDDAEAWNLTVVEPLRGPAAGAGTRGELLLAGGGLALGYLDDPGMTARRFGTEEGIRVHRTGDLAEWSGGSLRWTGRLDRQVKLNGRMACPEEVEAAAERTMGVPAACLAVPGGLRLVLETGDASLAARAAAAVAAELGEGFRPREVAAVPRLPRTPHGKVDLAALAVTAVTEAA